MKVGPQGDHPEIYRALVAHAFELMTVVDEGGDIVFENGAIERVTGYQMEERVGRSLFDFVHPEDAGRMKEAFDRARAGRGTTPRLDLRTRHRDGRWLSVESIARFIGGDVVHGLVHSQDVSERNDLRLRLRLAQRLTTLGRLTLGLADDFAKVVATIRTHLRSFKDVETSGSVSIGLRAIVNATETAGTLSQQLQAIGEMTPVFPDQVDVHELLNDVRRHVSDQVWLHVVPKAERSSIRTDRASLRQGLTNLVLSFRYAMPEGSLVAIATRNVVATAEPPHARGSPDSPDRLHRHRDHQHRSRRIRRVGLAPVRAVGDGADVGRDLALAGHFA